MLPVLLGAAAFLVVPVVVWLTSMGGAGDVGRWAAVSTMWLLIPVMIGAVILLVLAIAVAVAIGRVNAGIPRYSPRLQHLAATVEHGTKRATEMIRRPVLATRALGELVKSRFRQLREGS